MSVAEKVKLIWMSGDQEEVSRIESVPGELPEAITPAEDAAYLIVEEIAGETVTRTLCQPGDEAISVYYQGEQPWCLPDYMEIHWSE